MAESTTIAFHEVQTLLLRFVRVDQILFGLWNFVDDVLRHFGFVQQPLATSDLLVCS